MGWLGRGLGNFGSEVGQGYDINLGWKERLQQMALANARQKLEDLMGPLQLQQLQQQIKTGQQQYKQAQAPRYEGTVNLPGGGVGGISVDPFSGKQAVNPLVPSFVTSEAVGRQILNGRQSLSPQDQPYADQLLGSLRLGNDPSKVLDEWLRFFPGVTKGQKQKALKMADNGREVIVSDPFGNETNIPVYDAKGNPVKNLPPEVQKFVDSELGGIQAKELEQTKMAEAADERMLNRMQKTEDFRQKLVDQADAWKEGTTARTEAIAAFNKYQAAVMGQEKVAAGSHWYWPPTWGNTALFDPTVDAARQDAEEKRQNAVEKLKAAGIPVDAWLLKPIGPGTFIPPPTHPPPPNFSKKVSGPVNVGGSIEAFGH